METPQPPDRNLAMELDAGRPRPPRSRAAAGWAGATRTPPTAPRSTRCASCSTASSMDGVVVIGEGEKDEAPMLYNGEQIGDGSAPADGHRGRPDRRHHAHLARPPGRDRGDRARRAGHDVQPGPVRLHGEDRGRARSPPTSIDLNAPVKANLEAVAKALGERVSDVTAVILDRDRHDDIIRECREAGARIRLIPDGDVAGAISVAWRNSGTDMLFGIGGTPEGVIAACALKCLGGSIQGRLWPRNDDENARRARPRLRPRPRAHDRRPRVAATTCSSPRPASPTASSCRACATGATARARRAS